MLCLRTGEISDELRRFLRDAWRTRGGGWFPIAAIAKRYPISYYCIVSRSMRRQWKRQVAIKGKLSPAGFPLASSHVAVCLCLRPRCTFEARIVRARGVLNGPREGLRRMIF